MDNRKEGLSKRQARREEIRRKEQRQRVTVMSVIAGIVLLIFAAWLLPNLLGDDDGTGANTGEIVQATPVSYTNTNGTSMGDPNAPVKIDIFEDFQCPACKSYTFEVEPQVVKDLVETGQVFYTFHQYPFLDDNSTSKDSDRAAMAALCAADQNLFWNYKNLLYTNSQEVTGVFTEARLKEMAGMVDGLNVDEFEACYDEGRHQSDINEQVALGQQMGVTGTPSVFVEGVDVAPGRVPTFEQIQAAVQAATGD